MKNKQPFYCSKHEREFGADGCVSCLIDNMSDKPGGMAAAVVSADAERGTLQPAMLTFDEKQQLDAQRKRDQEFNENQLEERLKGGFRPLC